ncbi:hypothetical protein C1H76_6796 [Elsinoe australis]|uniref:Uncharacterized protein n=1 Tax=Elsinoe australis TaxID=40998 RepID=A0A4U7AUW2_9PEZI|nr:hypothetical protein C1H76_6796 [Elsinoe australis]
MPSSVIANSGGEAKRPSTSARVYLPAQSNPPRDVTTTFTTPASVSTLPADTTDIFAPQPARNASSDTPTVARYTSFPAAGQPPAASARAPNSTSLDASPSRKRPLSRSGQDLNIRKSRPAPLSSKSSSAVPTLSTTSVSASPSSPAPRSPAPTASPRTWLGRSVTATSVATLKSLAPQTAAESLRQTIMFG